MLALSISSGVGTFPASGEPAVLVFSDILSELAVPLSAGQGEVTIRIDSPKIYQGFYSVETDYLLSGPVNIQEPEIAQDATSGVLSLSQQGIWAYNATGTPPVLSYIWQRNGVNISGATGISYTPQAEDTGQNLRVLEIATDVTGVRSQPSAPVALLDPFEVSFEPGAFARLVGNDGRSFALDDPSDVHDGSYSVAPAALAAGPVGLTAPVLSGLAEAGETLIVTPPLFAYDAALGPVLLNYSTTATNAVDASDLSGPVLLLDEADAGTSVTVTATAIQDGVPLGLSTNTLAVAALPDVFEVVLMPDGTIQINGNDGRSFLIDDGAGIYDGNYSVDPVALAAGPVALVPPVLSGTGQTGTTLDITPALFAYDADLGGISVSYTTNATNTVDATDPDNPVLLVDGADAGQSLTVTATATQGANTTDSLSNAVVASAPVSAISAFLVGQADDATNTETPDFGTFDLSGLETGDRLLISVGTGGNAPTNVTVDGFDAGLSIIDTGARSTGARSWVYEYTMPGSGSVSSVISVTRPAATGNNLLTVVGIKGATRDDIQGDWQSNTGDFAVSVTSGANPNLIVAIAQGRASFLTDHAWTGVTEVDLFVASNGQRRGSVALASDVGAGSYNVTSTVSASAPDSDEMAVFVATYS